MMQDEFPTGQVRRDYFFYLIESRGLQFLLRNDELELYKEWLQRSPEYKQRIRELVADVTIENRL